MLGIYSHLEFGIRVIFGRFLVTRLILEDAYVTDWYHIFWINIEPVCSKDQRGFKKFILIEHWSVSNLGKN
jgi:hypothetical protein